MSPPVLLSPRRELWLLLTLAGIQFTHILDFMIMMPLGPQFRDLFGISDAQFGLLVSAYTLAAGVSGLLASTYIDRFGRKRLLLALYVLFGLATLACGLAPSYALLMVARIAAGFFGGVLSAICQTIVADVVPFERRGRAMGVVMTSFSVSTVAGVPLGLFLAAHFSWHAPFFGIAALCAVLTGLAVATLP
ncbi:MAG TPA: MFS transporter, partial [Ramlibacter sp.]|nr:MFS transporter [Ramlibacter sp.]